MNTNKLNVKGIIFDYGGTLDTNARHWAHVLWEGYRHVGVPVSEEQFREAYVFAERALAKAPIITPEDDFRQLLIKKVDIETRQLVEMGAWAVADEQRAAQSLLIAEYCYEYAHRTVTESREVLLELSKHYPLVLVSNFYGNIETILKDFLLDQFFPRVIESAVVGVRKPDPAIYQLGVDAIGMPAEDVLVVGDSYGKDIVPAKKVGCKAVWLKGEGWTKDEESDSSLADAVIYNLADLLTIV